MIIRTNASGVALVQQTGTASAHRRYVTPEPRGSAKRFSSMHPFALIAFALLLAAGPLLLLAAGPSLAAPSLPPEVESTREEEEPQGDRFEDRWQGASTGSMTSRTPAAPPTRRRRAA